ncbi:hypothetical protein PACTADRAFT_51305 [Pachysolen tannophilus NRRL Y-2460]|uniref:UDP-galactose transporter homolog 1 n=1 Tax=Pachysolen tannophilus NRRL Y-2460 TaxID=669874 RepID=A0A1E4TRW1_PACTA|nr:hypothetical protein PACTADRAFT_51305 [Pachysolen tannophilus NRRL Y-2460]
MATKIRSSLAAKNQTSMKSNNTRKNELGKSEQVDKFDEAVQSYNSDQVDQLSNNGNSLIATLIICVAGIYSSFLIWSILQEKISTTTYKNSERFNSPLFVNTIQSFFACAVGSIYLSIKSKKFTTPLSIFVEDGSKKLDFQVLQKFLVIATAQSLSSPISYKSLKHLNYLVFLLSKSCKLIPVMMVQFLVFGKKFPPHKYMVVGIITTGILIFTLSSSSSSKKGKADSNGDGAHLMSGINFLTCILTASYTFLATDDLNYSMTFISENPAVLSNILLYGLCGAIGQIFIFITLEKFDSIVLVTVTVTRKMFSMILSVLLFGHAINFKQWFGISLVFSGIVFEE